MVDQSLLRLFNDPLPAIGPFFYNQTRTGAFATEATNTFRYAPATVPVSQAVVDEAEREAAVAANAVDRLSALEASRHHQRAQRRVRGNAGSRGSGGTARRSGTGRGPETAPWRAPARRLRGARLQRRRAGMAGQERGTARGRAASRTPFQRKPRLSIGKQQLDVVVRGEGEEGRPRERFVETAYWNPARRHRQGRQGPGHVQGPVGPVGLSHHGARRHRRRHAGRPDQRRR